MGFAAAPRFLGIDDRGREILTDLDGEVTTEFMDRDWSEDQIASAGKLLRRLHDATADSNLAAGEQVMCQTTPTLNAVFVADQPVAVFDFDQAPPGPASATWHTRPGCGCSAPRAR